MNRALAIHVIEELIRSGVEEFIICPGGRNAPLVNLIATSSLKHTYLYEERSAAFYALGVARRTKRPVAVITTSGTAAGELLPATMEAYYSSVPLILVTADRPRRFRGSNAPQTAEQVGLYGVYTPVQYDVEGAERFELKIGHTPVHLNVCFEEPLADEVPFAFDRKPPLFKREYPARDPGELLAFLNKMQKPLVIVGTLAKENRESTARFLQRLGAPVYLEGVSGLRNESRLKELQVYFPQFQEYDSVLRIGGVPTHRIWRDLEEAQDKIAILSLTEHPFSGLSRSPFIYTKIGPYLDSCDLPDYKWNYDLEGQRRLQENFTALMAEEPLAEPSFIHQISRFIPQESLVYLGNSLPIRNWDICACYADPSHEIQATRGLNGIDGQISCFFGLAEDAKNNVAIIGDLTALYDFAAGFHKPSSFTLFIVNNGGGKIFSRRYTSPVFQHPHSLSFGPFAQFWDMPYQQWRSIPAQHQLGGLIELVPCSDSTMRFWKKWDHISKEVLCCK